MWREVFYDRKLQQNIITDINNYIGRLVRRYYSNKYFIVNNVLSRDPTESLFIERVVRCYKTGKAEDYGTNILFIIKKFLQYYARNIMHLFLFYLRFLAFKFSRYKKKARNIDKGRELIVIDTYTMIGRSFPDNRFSDPFFGGLYELLRKRGQQYAVLCILFGVKGYNIKRWWDTYNILADDDKYFITEYSLLTFGDYLRIIWFVLFYPVHALKIIFLRIDSIFDALYKDETIHTLDTVQFLKYLRYLTGKRLKNLTNKKITLISWYENQSVNKLLYKGLRDSGADCYIYGCQFYVQYSFWLHYQPLESEVLHSLVPDEILVSGKSYLRKLEGVKYKIGVSPRYDYLFKTEYTLQDLYERNNITVLLTIHVRDSQNIIKTVSESDLGKGNDIFIKLHPNFLVEKPDIKIPDTWLVTNETMEYICSKSNIIISAGSGGAILEAAVMGCSVIAIGSTEGLTFHCMPDLGRGEIWDIVFDAAELEDVYNRLVSFRKNNLQRIVELSKEYREMFFTEATEERFTEIFNLN
jgi:hypothetical protein